MNSQEIRNTNALKTKIVGLIDLKSVEILNSWLEDLMQEWGEKAERKLHVLIEDKKQKNDLFSVLLKLLLGTLGSEKENLDPIFYRIRMREYSISDFFLEVSYLEESIERVLRSSNEINEDELLDGMRLIRKKLSSIFRTILKEISEIYEYVIERGGRGFCQVDTKGLVIYANKEMKRLLCLESVAGKSFDSFFKGEEKDFVREAVSGKLGEKPEMRQLQLISPDGKSIPIGAEIGPILINGQYIGGYTSMVDISRAIVIQKKIFDAFPSGVVKVNTKKQITFANPKMDEIFGIETCEGKTIREVFPDKENFSIVERQLEKRFSRGLGDEYEVEITRFNDKKRIPVMITAMPETDLRGNIVGSLAIIRSLLLEKTIQAIHKHIETIRDGQDILRMVAEETNQIIPFELFTVTVYSADMKHVRSVFSYCPIPCCPTVQMDWQTRWREMSSYVRSWVNQREIVYNGNLVALLDKPQWQEFKDDPDVKKFLEQGFLSFIRYPIIRKDKVAASITLFSKAENAFDKNHKELLNALPLDKAVLVAFNYEKVRDLNFRLNLIKEISSASNNIQQVADLIVKRLVKHYEWQNVSIFRVDEGNQVIRLLSQEARDDSRNFLLQKDYEQPIKAGILGHVYQNKVEVNIGNVHEDPEFKGIYVEGYKGTVSELCLPIIKNSKVCWLLNIEDSHQNAFSEEEIAALKVVLNEVSALLERSWLLCFLKATLDSASDAIIVTDSKGNIKHVNSATEKLLGDKKQEMKGKALEVYFKDADMVDDILMAEKLPTDEVALCRKDGSEVNVLLSGSKLPEEFAQKVFVAKDLSLHKRMEELEFLGTMYNEIAIQAKTPLSLIFSWLRRLKRKSKADPTVNILDKVIRQLRKVEITYDRLALYDKKRGIVPYNELLLNMSEVLDKVIDEFPKTEIDKIDCKYDKPLPYIRGDIFQLSFCLETILSYLLRFVPEEEKISFKISKKPNWLIMEISGFFPGLSMEKVERVTKLSPVSRILAEIALGEKIISIFIDDHGGKFYEPKREGEKIEFRIDLPIATNTS